MSAGGMGGRIRTLRNAAGLNQTQLAGEAGVSQGTISDYEANYFAIIIGIPINTA